MLAKSPRGSPSRTPPSRPPALAGRSYSSSPGILDAEVNGYFRHPRGAGLPTAGPSGPGAHLRAIVVPHIDFGRGGPCYTWGYRALVEATSPMVVVILGVAHQWTTQRFVLSPKDFETPLGVVETDRHYVGRIAEMAGPQVMLDQHVHDTEHSIEFQAVFLRHLLGDRPFRIVPILVGSFHDLLYRGIDPIHDPEVARFIRALRAAEQAESGSVTYVGSVDFSHVGPEFGDEGRLEDDFLGEVRSFDGRMLDCLERGDPAGWFARAAAVQDRYRLCGLWATYTLLHAIGPCVGTRLQYEMAVDRDRTCGVSFASLALHGAPR